MYYKTNKNYQYTENIFRIKSFHWLLCIYTERLYINHIINIFIDIESQIIGDIEIKYFLLLENDQNGVVVGTVKTMRVDGDYDDPFFTMLNNTMYIETDDGTEQVQIIDDQLYFVE